VARGFDPGRQSPGKTMAYTALADAVLLLHLAVVLFVIGGLAAVLVGNVRGWRWVNGRAFRALHLLAIVFVALQAWLGQACPLTTLENWLRRRDGGSGYSGGFVEHWVQWLLYYEAPAWVFALCYTLFALAVAAAWWRFPPRRHA
jgi:hypothetical protein